MTEELNIKNLDHLGLIAGMWVRRLKIISLDTR